MIAEHLLRTHGTNSQGKAPVQHAVFRWLWRHPNATEKECAGALHISHAAVRVAMFKIRKYKRVERLCPECFTESLSGLVCTHCGADFTSEAQGASLPEFSSQSPIHSIQPLGGLGSVTDYRALKPKYGALNIAHLVDDKADAMIEKARSLLWQELKSYMLPDAEVEAATRMLLKEITEFRIRYPGLLRSKGLAAEMVNVVLSRIKLQHPDVKLLTISSGDDK